MLFKQVTAVLAAATLARALPTGEEPAEGFKVVIVHVSPPEGCAECQAPPNLAPNVVAAAAAPTVTPSPSASFVREEPVATLRPNNHWDFDTAPATNIVPMAADEGSRMYYGAADPKVAGEFAYLTYYFTRPSVNLDQSDHVSDVVYGPDGLSITLTSEAWGLAVDSWSDEDELVLITDTEDCGASSDRCFFKVSGITLNEQERVIVAQGSPVPPEELISRGESEWGYYVPDGAAQSGAAASQSSSDACVAPADETHGLPTACLGAHFDRDLDAELGREQISQEYRSFLDSAAQTSSLVRRCGWLCDAINDFIIEPVKDVFEAVQDALTIAADFDEEFSFKVPDPQGEGPVNELLNGLINVVDSPFGDAIQLFTASAEVGEIVDAEVSIFCVGCGVTGTSRIAGKASFVPFEGITEGFIELTSDLQFGLKIGIDAQVAVAQEFGLDLFSVGLPGLAFGIVTIGPSIDIGANVALEAAVGGQLLAGGDLSLQGARALIDFVNPENTDATGFHPSFQPVFQADGNLALSATLALPVGLRFGIQIATFDVSAGLVDEPSITGSAEIAAEVELVDGQLEGGFVDVDGCPGIAGQLSFRNRLFVEITGFDNIDLLDTGDLVLLEGCLELAGIAPVDGAPVDGAPVGDAPVDDVPVDGVEPAPEHTVVVPHPPAGTPVVHYPVHNISHPVNATTHAVPTATATPLHPGLANATTTTHPAPAETQPVYEYSSPASWKDAAGIEYANLVGAGSKLTSCSNGNIYAVGANNPSNPSCSDTFQYKAGALVGDGAARVMHYYNNTMFALGVSRLRIDAETDSVPSSGVVIAWAPAHATDGSEALVAVDPRSQVFYPLVCEFEGGAAKVFLAEDPVAGAAVLASEAVQHSVTGGRVSGCSPLRLSMGAGGSSLSLA